MFINTHQYVPINTYREIFDNNRFEEANCIISPDDQAYIIYTSGSTGKPKGVVLQHKGMLNHLFAKVNDLGMNRETKLAFTSSISFDISIWQMLTPLVLGGTVGIYTDEEIRNLKKFIGGINDYKISILEVVPTFINLLLDIIDEEFQFPYLSTLIATGEELKPNLVDKWYKRFPEISLVNAYGPTEASDDITHYTVPVNFNRDLVPIGYPIQNMKINLIDEHQKICPVGIAGEICVTGIGVGKGYLNNEEQTDKAFVDYQYENISGYKTYKTGDIGRYLYDGSIEFYGRIDNQVKIRGNRIELGEIERVIASSADVKDCVVIVRTEDMEDGQLCAYLLANQGYEEKLVRSYLVEYLPSYMVPDYFVVLDSFPTNANGKIDKKALPKPDKK
jgi:amino acid adenylation domain-containing protein